MGEGVTDMRILATAVILIFSASLALGSFLIEAGPLIHYTCYDSESRIAPGLSISALFEIMDATTAGLTGEFSMINLNDKAGIGLLELRREIVRASRLGLQLGILVGFLFDTIPGGSGLIGDWEPHIHIAFGPRLILSGDITDRLGIKIAVSGLFVGNFFSEYPSELPVIDYLSLGVSLGYTF